MAGRKSFGEPQTTDALTPDGALNQSLTTWISILTIIGQAAQSSGVSADRPTDTLWIGREYYDTTLNKPVYVSAVKPTVWRDASGAVV